MGFSDLGSPPKAHPADKVVGAIKCALEPIVSTEVPSASPVANNLYIETLLLQAPYRGNGIAKALLESLLYRPVQPSECNQASGHFLSEDVSDIVRHYNIRTVSAHVHEDNEDALAWYVARGFIIQPVTIEGYYHKMRPTGAKIVVKALHWVVDEQQHSSKPSAADASDSYLSPRKRIKMLPEFKGKPLRKEPNTGLETSNPKTRAVRDGDDYVISGSSPHGPTCPHGLPRRSQEVYFELKKIKKMGGRAVDANEVFFDGYRVSKNSSIGEEDMG
ncbi:hypothetical protein KEM56_000997 [Ascosphaera pollenicola]|nr:hypothetical protein KEM56_000997 [Ascosphaera pollenicola]